MLITGRNSSATNNRAAGDPDHPRHPLSQNVPQAVPVLGGLRPRGLPAKNQKTPPAAKSRAPGSLAQRSASSPASSDHPAQRASAAPAPHSGVAIGVHRAGMRGRPTTQAINARRRAAIERAADQPASPRSPKSSKPGRICGLVLPAFGQGFQKPPPAALVADLALITARADAECGALFGQAAREKAEGRAWQSFKTETEREKQNEQ